MIEASGQDLRQIINILQMWKNQNISKGDSTFIKSITKDEKVMINNYDAAKKLLNHGDNNLNRQYPSFREKLDLFFIDHDFVPMLVHESYLNSMQNKSSLQDLENMADAADLMSVSDQANI